MYTWGANSHGQLGIGNFEDKYRPNKVDFDDTPVIVAGGGSQSIAVCDSFAYAVGKINKSDSRSSCQFKPIGQFEQPVMDVSMGWDFSLFLTNDGNMYTYGLNSICFPLENYSTNDLSFNDSLKRINIANIHYMSAGLSHAITVSNSGVVTYWPSSRSLQNKQNKITKIDWTDCKEYPGNIIGCAAGTHYSTIWTDFGHVGIFGKIRFGQGGPLHEMDVEKSKPSDITKVQWIPNKYFNNEKIISVKSGWSHLLALTDTGKVYSWGRCDFGQLGRSCGDQDTSTVSSRTSEVEIKRLKSWPNVGKSYDPLPRQISFLCTNSIESTSETTIQYISTGSEHCLAIDSYRRLWSWGWNEHGMCGILPINMENEEHELSPENSFWCLSQPQMIHFPDSKPFPAITCMAAGYGHSIAYVKQ